MNINVWGLCKLYQMLPPLNSKTISSSLKKMAMSTFGLLRNAFGTKSNPERPDSDLYMSVKIKKSH